MREPRCSLQDLPPRGLSAPRAIRPAGYPPRGLSALDAQSVRKGIEQCSEPAASVSDGALQAPRARVIAGPSLVLARRSLKELVGLARAARVTPEEPCRFANKRNCV